MKHFWNTKLAIIFFIVGLFSYTISAQKITRFSNKEGFNQNTINTISKDKYGFLWFGTPNGLIRYDGYDFKTFSSQANYKERVESTNVKFLFNDDNGVLWIGTNLGLNVYIPRIEKFYKVPLNKSISVDLIKAGPGGEIIFIGDHKLHSCKLINEEEGVFKVSEDVFNPTKANERITNFSFQKNTLLLGTNNGLKKLTLKPTTFDVESEVYYKEFQGNSITAFLSLESENLLFIGTSKGFYKTAINRDEITIFKSFGNNDNTSIPPLRVSEIIQDSSGDIWFATQGNGLYNYTIKSEVFKHYSYDPKDEYGLGSKIVNSLFQDDYDVLWIGTAQGGLNKLDLAQKEFVTYSNNFFDSVSLSDNLITSILEDNKGRLWLSGFNIPLYRSTSKVTDKTVQNLEFENLKSQVVFEKTDVVRHIYEDSKGFIWIGSDQCTVVYHPQKNQFKKVSLTSKGKALPNRPIRGFIEIDEKNMMSIGFDLKIIRNPWNTLKNQINPLLEISAVLHQPGVRFQTVIKDTETSFWFGTNKGLLHGQFDGRSIQIDQEYSHQDSESQKLSNSDVFSLYQNKQKELLIGTFGGGLNKLTHNKSDSKVNIEVVSGTDVHLDDVIYGILPENDDNLWLSTDIGLINYNSAENTAKIFDVRDGLTQNNFRQGAFYKGTSGYFYFGGLNGLNIFKPNAITLNRQTPKILITELYINNEQIKIGDELNGNVILEASITEKRNLRIREDQRVISFNVVAKQSSTPSKNKIAYKLEGFDNVWTEKESGKQTITYTNLSSGNYTLKIKAANSDGLWGDETAQIDLKIVPLWYKTWWSYSLYLLLFVGIILGVIIYFVRLEKLKQRLNYEQLDKDRLEVINQGKFRYFTNLSHEFRTPLSLISGPLERLIDLNKENESNQKYLSIIQKNSKRLLSLANQLITFRQAEQGQLNLNLTKLTLAEFIYPTTEAFENYAYEKNINFFYKIEDSNTDIVVDIEKLERILYNLLSNAFKNTPSQGSIWIEAKIVTKKDKKRIKIEVVDTGKGIEKKYLETVFQRFYQLGSESKSNISGGGIGLSFCKTMLTLLGGSIKAKSTPGIETRFSFTVPLKQTLEQTEDTNSQSTQSFIKHWVPLNSTTYEFSNAQESKKDKHTILIVEDQEDVRNFLSEVLSETYNVVCAINGIEGLEKLTQRAFDLVLSDVMMDGMDGFEFTKQVKSNSTTSHIPVILLTALNEDDDIIKGLEIGADEYISKPFSVKHLELRIQKFIETNQLKKDHFSKSSFAPPESVELNTKDREFIDEITTIIEENLANSSFGVEELAKEMMISSSHFYRKLKTLTGQIPNAYLRKYRLNKAAELLTSNEGYNVSEVMYQIGIESSSYFSTAFKKLYGVSPSDYKK